MRHADEQVVLVVDFGAQYAQLIARRVRELHVYSEVVPARDALAFVRSRRPAAVILSGGPASVYAPGAPGLAPEVLEANVPILGICYGAQLMAQQLGGVVEHGGSGEYGRTVIERTDERAHLLPPLRGEAPETVWMSHADAIVAPPEGARVVASSAGAPVAAFEDPARRRFGVQWHPEVSHTPGGMELLGRFLFDVVGLEPRWTSFSIIEQAIAEVRSTVGDGRAICALSGGVDSTVAAALTAEAIGDRLTCVFVDTGLLRSGEAEQVEHLFRSQFDIELIVVDAADRFFDALAGVTDPEAKRKIIGELFIRIFEETAASKTNATHLVQGTLYPDIVESGSDGSATIKSHHNVGGLPDDVAFTIVEPLRRLFKDEVRRIGVELGIPESFVWRQPFPGPGIAVRVLGEVTAERVETVRRADRIVQDELDEAGLSRSLWQAFAVLAPGLRSVGVSGDARTYDAPVIVRAVESEDAMTADWARLPWEVLDRISRRIVNEVPGVNRVVYDVTSKPPGTIEWE
ncbi:GMP synthase, large subunit [Acidimicrobium ferrooxidans DSM 10331]|uniref:GMP synthase [glutamine-hydrolyzing] n=1 Tax=Acidimicrobium ferrooxidans (strain DSM 10331 / JCM 15462 / NBRC 103882 / ICP) TaxID=525909 RepID=C7M334_ACIFD|nr:glutamine-hydrolyzing GMP synthase [Acidimicrobium ferrooxidans]ACU53428.1 GMP synthase, large subunit [Acidimicrobium ferrooxidans DSM 10331]